MLYVLVVINLSLALDYGNTRTFLPIRQRVFKERRVVEKRKHVLGSRSLLPYPQLFVQQGHLGDVDSRTFSMAFSPDGHLLVSIGDKTIRLYDVASGQEVRTLTGHRIEPSVVAFSPNGRMLVSAGDNYPLGTGEIKLWNVDTGQLLDEVGWDQDKREIGSIAFNSKNNLIAIGGVAFESYIDLWGVTKGRLISHYPLRDKNRQPHHADALAFSPDDHLLAVGYGDGIEIWDMVTRQVRYNWAVRHGSDLFYSADGRLLVVVGLGEPGPPSEVINVWNVRTGVKLSKMTVKEGISVLAFNQKENRIFALLPDGKAKTWSIQTNGEVVLTDPFISSVDGTFIGIHDVAYAAFSPNAKLLAIASKSGDIIIQETSTRQVVSRFKSRAFARPIQVGFNPLDTELASATPTQVMKWDLLSGRMQYFPIYKSWSKESESYEQISNMDGSFLLSFDKKHVELWNIKKYKQVSLFKIIPLSENLMKCEGLRDPVFDVDVIHDRLAIGVGNCLSIVNLSVGKQIWFSDKAFVQKSCTYQHVIFTQDGQSLVATCGDSSISILNLATKDVSGFKYNDESVVEANIGDLAISPNGQWIVSVIELKRAKDFVGYSPAFENLIAFVPVSLSVNNHDIYIIRANSSLINKIVFSPDGKWLALGGYDNVIELWRLNYQQVPRRVQMKNVSMEHSSDVLSLAFNHNGSLLASASDDGTIRIWEVRTGKQLATLLSTEDGAGWLVVTPEGLFDGTADAMQQVSWRIGNRNKVIPLDSFFNDFYHPGLLAEIMRGGRPTAVVDIATVLQLPGLRVMLSQGLARFERRASKSVLCFSDRPTAAPQIFADAQPLAFDPNDLTFHEDDLVCPWQKELPNNKQYEVISAIDTTKIEGFRTGYDGVRSDTTHSTLHVQIVGVGNYNFASTGFKALPSSVSGANEIEKFFAQQKANQTKPYQDIKVWPSLYDQEATREKIRQRLDEMAKEVKEDDVVFLFFSGHGIVPAGQEMFYFAPIDIRGPNFQDQRETGLNTAMLTDAVRNLPARRVVLIIDACQSGGAIESLRKIAEVKAKVEERRAQVESKGQGDNREHEVGVYVIAAATPLQEAVQPKAGNGALVKTLLEGLRSTGQVNDKRVWMRDLVKYIQQHLPEVSTQIGQRHTPMIVSSGLDFSIAEKKPITLKEKAAATTHQ
jgi:WD40 repeat protein